MPRELGDPQVLILMFRSRVVGANVILALAVIPGCEALSPVALFADASGDMSWDPGYLGEKYAFADMVGGSALYDPQTDEVTLQIQVEDASKLESRPQNHGGTCRLGFAVFRDGEAWRAGSLEVRWGWQSPGPEWVNATWTAAGSNTLSAVKVHFDPSFQKPGSFSWVFPHETLLKYGSRLANGTAYCSVYNFVANPGDVPVPGTGGQDRASGDATVNLSAWHPSPLADNETMTPSHGTQGSDAPAGVGAAGIPGIGTTVIFAILTVVGSAKSWRRP